MTATAAGVLALYDTLAPVTPAELVGRWRGAELPTGSRLDGLLTLHRWVGKDVVDAETVHPLLFAGRRGTPVPVTPWPAPLGLLLRAPGLARTPLARAGFAVLRPLLRARRPGARVRTVTARGVATAAIVYDALPVVDTFRRVDGRTLLGLMDMRGLDEPFAFVLSRPPDRAGAAGR
ncbi:GXWXG domain-containing protein [Blastococcus sp. URHD0036]|uniref:DUF4334 domain-containing protein n=1 Tax=Blastococcus sp. URHD0036 TaxID=1380356 RepID=UPI0004978F22|nr:GXWXG domain-containing protein [Blastococcus sp. URHD0036]